MFLHTILASPRFRAGTEGRAKLLEAVSAEAREIIDAPIFTSSWYDERISVEVARATVAILGIEGEDAIRAHFRALQLPGLGRIYRVILSMMTPDIIAKKSGWFWQRTHDSGEIEVESVKDGVMRARCVKSPTVADPIYSLAVLGGIEGIVSLTGATPVTGKRWILGPDETRIEIRWGASATEP
jgi:hypothetical protein